MLPKINSACFWSLVVSWPGYINKPHNKQGTDLQVVVRGKRYPAKVWVSAENMKHKIASFPTGWLLYEGVSPFQQANDHTPAFFFPTMTVLGSGAE